MKTMFIGVIIVAIIVFIVILAVVMINEIEKQQWIDKMSTGHTDCQILRASGEPWLSCQLEYLKDARTFCQKYPDFNPQMCIELERDIAASPQLSQVFP